MEQLLKSPGPGFLLGSLDRVLDSGRDREVKGTCLPSFVLFQDWPLGAPASAKQPPPISLALNPVPGPWGGNSSHNSQPLGAFHPSWVPELDGISANGAFTEKSPYKSQSRISCQIHAGTPSLTLPYHLSPSPKPQAPEKIPEVSGSQIVGCR